MILSFFFFFFFLIPFTFVAMSLRFALVIVCGALAVGACAGRIASLPATGALSGTVRHDTDSAPVDATTLDRKLLFGYQGWFGCPGDGSPLGSWEHWFNRGTVAGAASLRVDMWPDITELDP